MYSEQRFAISRCFVHGTVSLVCILPRKCTAKYTPCLKQILKSVISIFHCWEWNNVDYCTIMHPLLVFVSCQRSTHDYLGSGACWHQWGRKDIYQDLSKHQEVDSTPVTKVTTLIMNFWDLLGANLIYFFSQQFEFLDVLASLDLMIVPDLLVNWTW